MINFGSPSQPERGNVGVAVLAGLVVAIACAVVWGVIAYSTKYQFSIMAILVGLAVGTCHGQDRPSPNPRIRGRQRRARRIRLRARQPGRRDPDPEPAWRAAERDPVSAERRLPLLPVGSRRARLPVLGLRGAVRLPDRDGRLDALGLEPPEARSPAIRHHEPAVRHGATAVRHSSNSRTHQASSPTAHRHSRMARRRAYGAPQPFDGVQPAQPGDATQQTPEFGFKQPPPGTGSPQP